MSTRTTVSRILLLATIALLGGLPAPAWAQQFTGTLRGTVQDATHALLPGAQVSVIEIATNDSREIVTDGQGRWVLPNLKPGTYRVVVTLDGFKKAAVDQVKLDVQGIREIDVTLEVGGAAETVTVTGAAAAIETTRSTLSLTIENRRMVDLPLNGRNPFALATLAPGVTPTSNNGGSSPSISGGRNATSEVAIDGVSNVNAENNVSILDLNYTPSVDAVQEFSVQTNAVSAEFGRLGGGVLNLVTKGGSNTLRATAWEFGRNAKLDATNFFTNRAGGKKGAFKRNQFGGNLGGPLIKDRTFFFANYEGLRQESASVSTFTVPLPAWRAGDFSDLRNGSGQLITIYDPATTRPDPDNAGTVHPRSVPRQHHPGQPHQSGGAGDDGLLAAAERHAVQRRSRRPTTTRCRACSQATAIASILASIMSSAIAGAASCATPTRTSPVCRSTASATPPRRQGVTARLTRRRTACRSITTIRSGRPGC